MLVPGFFPPFTPRASQPQPTTKKAWLLSRGTGGTCSPFPSNMPISCAPMAMATLEMRQDASFWLWDIKS